MHWVTKGFLDLLFPPRCLVCRRFDGSALCKDCAAALPVIAPPFCHRCGLPFDPQAKGGPLCASCRGAQRLPFTLGRSIARYEWPMRDAVHRLKYDGRRVLGRVLGEMMAAALLDGPSPLGRASTDHPQEFAPRLPFDELALLLPVPLHPLRMRERGFNQAELLCGALSQRTGVPIAVHCLQRVTLSQPQVAVPTNLRRANVRGAFAVTDPPAVAGRDVLVFDDVWTTGSTLIECARVLRRAGARTVHLLSLCRATPP